MWKEGVPTSSVYSLKMVVDMSSSSSPFNPPSPSICPFVEIFPPHCIWLVVVVVVVRGGRRKFSSYVSTPSSFNRQSPTPSFCLPTMDFYFSFFPYHVSSLTITNPLHNQLQLTHRTQSHIFMCFHLQPATRLHIDSFMAIAEQLVHCQCITSDLSECGHLFCYNVPNIQSRNMD